VSAYRAAKYPVDPSKFSTVLTSCGRFDLLEETVETFLEHFDANKIIIAEDADLPMRAAGFAARNPLSDVRVNTPKLGQMRSIDKLYASLDTPYVLHLEDDWGFTRGLDLEAVTDFLTVRPDISVVCIAHREYNARFAPFARRTEHAGIPYLVWDLDAHPKWFSYSFNPSIARRDFWCEVGPFERFVTEENLSLYCKARGMRIALVDPGIAEHIGDERHAPDPFQPARAKTLVSRLRRSVAKRWGSLVPQPQVGPG
jgi:hypothetical protein